MSRAEVLLQRCLAVVVLACLVSVTSCAGNRKAGVEAVVLPPPLPPQAEQRQAEQMVVSLEPSATPPEEPPLSAWYQSLRRADNEPQPSFSPSLSPSPSPPSRARKKVSYRKDGKLVIGLLLPQTRYGKLAKAMEQAARFALQEKDSSNESRFLSVRLLVRDSEAMPRAAQELFSLGADVVLGPVLAEKSKPAALAATHAKRILITFSNNTEIQGAFAYRFGLSPRQQTQTLLAYVLSGDPSSKIAVVAPQNKYGRLVAQSALDYLKQRGRAPERIDFLDPQLEYDQLDGQIRHIADYDYRQLALQVERKKLALEKSTLEEDSPQALEIEAQLEKLKKEQTFGPPPFDVLLLPEARQQILQVVSSYFALYDVDPKTVDIYGLAPWGQMRKLQREPQLHQTRYAFVPLENLMAFAQRWREKDQRQPQMLEALTYDAVKTVARLGAKQGFVTRRQLEDPRGFSGATGRFRFRAEGEVQRLYEIREITRGGSKRIAKPPRAWKR